jgi:hypothetical protein
MTARIFRPTRSAMQSGRANTKEWVLEFEANGRAQPEPLMGWSAGSNTDTQLRLSFDTKELAIAYATREGLAYQVIEPQERRPRPKSYSDNFRFDRRLPWSH